MADRLSIHALLRGRIPLIFHSCGTTGNDVAANELGAVGSDSRIQVKRHTILLDEESFCENEVRSLYQDTRIGPMHEVEIKIRNSDFRA